jgi:UDP-N-acetylglucosamine/UDP-N-acetylgalactosamine diphosphorylase
MSVEFVQRVASDPKFALPFHRADKKVAFCDPANGRCVEPDEPNAVKLEMFVFDALPLAERSIVLETDRVEEFAPIKNAHGADSPLTSRELQTERAARWLEARGVVVPRNTQGVPECVIEISPLTATDPSHLEGVELPESIEPGSEIML